MELQKIISFAAAMSLSAQLWAQGEVVTLQHLWDEAERNSTSIKVMKSELDAANLAVEAAKSGNLPDLNASLSIGYLGDGVLTDRNFKNSLHVDNPHFMNSFAVQASQLIYGGGAVRNAVKTAESGRNIAALNLESERQNLRLMIAGYYLDICRLWNQTAVLDENLRLCGVVIENMRVMESQGTALSNDILRYELQKEGLLLSKRKVSDGLQILYRRIATATGYEGKNDFAPDTVQIAQMIENLNDTTLQNSYADNGVNVRISQEAAYLAENQLKTIKSGMLPQVAVVAEDHFDGPITIEVPVIDKNFNYWFAGIGVKYSISSLYKTKRDVRRAEISLQAANDRIALAKERAGDDVFAAHTDFFTARAEIQTQQKSVELAAKNYNVTLSRYNNGLATITDMLDASNTKLNAEILLVDSKINLLYNYLKIIYLNAEL